MKRATRRDVAEQAGVSVATVTYVLRNTGSTISKDTRQRVLDAASNLGYQPSFAAASLVRGRTEVVGLLLEQQERQFRGYYARMISGLVAASRETPYHFLYLGQDQTDKYLRCLSSGLLDGVMVLQSTDDDTHVKRALESRLPVVTMNYESDAGAPSVSVDYEGALDLAYEQLLARGRRRIAYFLPPSDLQPNRRQIARHYQLVELFQGRAELQYFDPGEDLADAAARVVRTGGHDGYVVEGLGSALTLQSVLAGAVHGAGNDNDIAAINIVHLAEEYPPDICVIDAPHVRVGHRSWRVLESMLAGRDLEAQRIREPFDVLSAGRQQP